MKLIISLTTLPTRWETIQPCLESLVNQEYEDFEIHLNLPLSTKWDGGFNKDEIKDIHPLIKVYYVEDKGPITKVYYTLQRFKGSNQRIVSVDDDVVYDKDMLNHYNEWAKKLPNDTLGYNGICIVDGELTPVRDVDTPTNVDILEGYKSVCYLPSHFEDDFFDEFWNRNIFDDPTLSGYLKHKNINRLVIPHSFGKSSHWFKSFPTNTLIGNPPSGCEKHKVDAGDYKTNYTKFFEELNKN